MHVCTNAYACLPPCRTRTFVRAGEYARVTVNTFSSVIRYLDSYELETLDGAAVETNRSNIQALPGRYIRTPHAEFCRDVRIDVCGHRRVCRPPWRRPSVVGLGMHAAWTGRMRGHVRG